MFEDALAANEVRTLSVVHWPKTMFGPVESKVLIVGFVRLRTGVRQIMQAGEDRIFRSDASFEEYDHTAGADDQSEQHRRNDAAKLEARRDVVDQIHEK